MRTTKLYVFRQFLVLLPLICALPARAQHTLLENASKTPVEPGWFFWKNDRTLWRDHWYLSSGRIHMDLLQRQIMPNQPPRKLKTFTPTREEGRYSEIQMSSNGRWLLHSRQSDVQRITALSLDGTQRVQWHAPKRGSWEWFASSPQWMADNRHWIAVASDRWNTALCLFVGDLESPGKIRSVPVKVHSGKQDRLLHLKILGTLIASEALAVDRSASMMSGKSEYNLYEVSVFGTAAFMRLGTLDVSDRPGASIRAVLFSSTTHRLAIELTSSREDSVEIITCNVDGNDRRSLGIQKGFSRQPLAWVAWLPSGESLSFWYGNAIWILPDRNIG